MEGRMWLINHDGSADLCTLFTLLFRGEKGKITLSPNSSGVNLYSLRGKPIFYENLQE